MVRRKAAHILADERDAHPRRTRVALCALEHGLRAIEPDRAIARLRKPQRQRARTAGAVEYSLAISCGSSEDSYADDNSGTIQFGYTDLGLDLTKLESGDVVSAVATVTNLSGIDTVGTLTLKKNDAAGEVLAVYPLGTIQSGSSVTTEIDYGTICGLVQPGETLYFEVTSSIEDRYDSDNNSIYVVPTVTAETQTDEFIYTVSGGEAQIVAYSGVGSNVNLPFTLGGLPVTSIGENVFSGDSAITNIYVPNTVTSVSANSFSGCTNLRYVYFMGDAPAVVSGGDATSGNKLSASPFGENVTVYFRIGTTGWDNSTWSSKAIEILPGDISGDGKFNMIDAVAFVQRLAQGGAALYNDIEFVSVDILRDGAVNMADIVKMVQALANPSIVLY